MKYYQHPKSGIGKILAYHTSNPDTKQTYNIPEIILGQYVYNWSNMLDEYKTLPNINYNEEQSKVVALLM